MVSPFLEGPTDLKWDYITKLNSYVIKLNFFFSPITWYSFNGSGMMLAIFK